MYFRGITPIFQMKDAKLRGDWYGAYWWYQRMKADGWPTHKDEFEEIVRGMVMLDELGCIDPNRWMYECANKEVS